jgi:hypothetical protein
MVSLLQNSILTNFVSADASSSITFESIANVLYLNLNYYTIDSTLTTFYIRVRLGFSATNFFSDFSSGNFGRI